VLGLLRNKSGFSHQAIPVCWNCGCAKVRRSHTQVVSDIFFSMAFLKSYRCRGCRVHFYGFHRRLPEGAGESEYSVEGVTTRMNANAGNV
jgi:hypothetical protein